MLFIDSMVREIIVNMRSTLFHFLRNDKIVCVIFLKEDLLVQFCTCN